MAKKDKTEKIEKEYVIPLRSKYQHVPRYKKTPKAIKSVKEFLARHMKIYDRDLNKIKLSKYLNEYLWARGIKNPPHKVKVKAVKEGDIVRVELMDMPDKLKYKKIRAEKVEAEGKKAAEKKKTLKEKTQEAMKPKEETEEKKEKESSKESQGSRSPNAVASQKEKKAAVVEAGLKEQKKEAKQQKHTTQIKQNKQIQKAKTGY